MNKRNLKKLRTLNATPLMINLAKQDKATYENAWGHTQVKYKTGIYMRCQILSDILKVAFFLTEDLKRDDKTPRYELFINNQSGEFITWDAAEDKWRTAKLDMLDWPQYTWNAQRWINPEGYKSIKNYLGTANGGYKGLLDYQINVRADELKKKHRKETLPWDLMLEQTPELPKDWNEWVDKSGMTQHYIFYTYSRDGAKNGYCTRCETSVPIKHPKHNKYGVCPRCGRKIQYKARGKAGSFYTYYETVYLMQKCEDGFMIRQFNCWRRYQRGLYETPDRLFNETRRVLFDQNLERNTFYYGDYKNTGCRWIKTYNLRAYYQSQRGNVYKRTLKSIEPFLKKTGLLEMIQGGMRLDPEAYIVELKQEPILEKLAKLGLTNLASCILEGHDRFSYNENKDFAKSLEIDKMRLKRLREYNGSGCMLHWLRDEKMKDTIYKDKCLKFFDKNHIYPRDLKFMGKFMKLEKINNFLKKQSELSGIDPLDLVQTYEDYINMASRVGMDIKSELIYKPKDLKKAHDEAVKLTGGKEIALRAGEIANKFPQVDQICKEIQQKYTFNDNKYAIVVPGKIEDIVREGQILGHCLDRTDIYFDRITRRESFIVFLRKMEEIDKPYYTLEIEPGGNARQKRTLGDKQNKDFEEAKGFIRKWQKEIQKRLTAEDMDLAKISDTLREQEFKELREKKAKIWHGHLAGHSLADVLEADFMAVKEAIAEERKCS